jgi:hypothetical protein
VDQRTSDSRCGGGQEEEEDDGVDLSSGEEIEADLDDDYGKDYYASDHDDVGGDEDNGGIEAVFS